MLYESRRFVVTSTAAPGSQTGAFAGRAWVTWLASHQSQSKVEDFECKSRSFLRSKLTR